MVFYPLRLAVFPMFVEEEDEQAIAGIGKYGTPDYSDVEDDETIPEHEGSGSEFSFIQEREVLYALGQDKNMFDEFLKLDIEDPDNFKKFAAQFGVKAAFFNLMPKKDDSPGKGIALINRLVRGYLGSAIRTFGYQLHESVEYLVPKYYRYEPSDVFDFAVMGIGQIEKIRLEVMETVKRIQRDLRVAIKAKNAGWDEAFFLIVNHYIQEHCRIRIIPKLTVADEVDKGDDISDLSKSILKIGRSDQPYEPTAPVVEPLDIAGAAFLALMEYQFAPKKGKRRHFYCSYCGNYIPAKQGYSKYCRPECARKMAQSNPLYLLHRAIKERARRQRIDPGSDEWVKFDAEYGGLKARFDDGQIAEDQAKKEGEAIAEKYGLEKRRRGRPTISAKACPKKKVTYPRGSPRRA